MKKIGLDRVGKLFVFSLLIVATILQGCQQLGKIPIRGGKNRLDATLAISTSAGSGESAIVGFQNTFWNFGRQNCTDCHSTTQAPLFALADLDLAYQVAKNPGVFSFDLNNPAGSAYVAYANNGHCGRASCSGKGSQALAALEAWADAEAAAAANPPSGNTNNSNTNNNGNTNGPTGSPRPTARYFSGAVNVPATLPMGATYAIMRWQLANVVPAVPAFQPAVAGGQGPILEMEIQLLNANTYRIRNPKIIGLRTTLEVRGIHVLIKRQGDAGVGNEDPLGDYWVDAAGIAPVSTLPNPLPATAINIAGTILRTDTMPIEKLTANDAITIGFGELIEGRAVAAGYASIAARIVGPKCLLCHSTALRKGGVDLSSYATVKAQTLPGSPNASAFFLGITQGGMPYMTVNAVDVPGTPLSTEEKNAIQTWITNGSLNN